MLDPLTSKVLIELGFQAKKRAEEFANNKIEKQVMEETIDRVTNELEAFINTLTKRTRLYLLLMIIGALPLIASIFVQVGKSTYYIAFSLIILFIGYMGYEFVRNIRFAVDFITNYEDRIKSELESSFERAKEENWKKKLAVFLGTKKSHDYFETVLASIVLGFFEWVKNNKWQIYVRMSAYLLSGMALSFVLRSLI